MKNIIFAAIAALGLSVGVAQVAMPQQSQGSQTSTQQRGYQNNGPSLMGGGG